MQAWLAENYSWIKALHLIAVISWMAGMLYLPRLYVYHCETTPGSAESERFKVMERRLLRAIVNPAMIATWILGLSLAWSQDLWSQGWLHAKLALLVAMQVMHALFSRWRRDFAADRNTRPARVYRIANEIPNLLMIAIVILAVVKPF